MPTIYDVFAEIIERAPCKAKDLPFKKPVYAQLDELAVKGWVQKKQQSYVPMKKAATTNALRIIKYCLKNGLDYNVFFSKNMPVIIKEVFAHAPLLRPKKLIGNKRNTELLGYLEENQFLLLTKKRPREGLVLRHQLFATVVALSNTSFALRSTPYIPLFDEVLKLRTHDINPFDDEVFSFLSGSAQLEGSTVTTGETRELLVNDIYPDKPKKDVQMIKNLNEAMHYVLENLHEEITPSHLCELNKAVLFSLHRNAGKYKKTHNTIQGNPSFKTAKPSEVRSLVESYCAALQRITSKEQCLKEAGFVHNELQHIHPFSDGNSRTTRMVLNWVLLKYSIPLLVIKMGCFDEYMGLTKLSKKRDDRRLTMLFHHLLLHEHLIK
ncbi:Fic family protein [Candidatus Woesearchaeota archaeon]|nr:Fic family protein [Candidatus Woesearchaeota archaeon]